jgi:hypothetical protein
MFGLPVARCGDHAHNQQRGEEQEQEKADKHSAHRDEKLLHDEDSNSGPMPDLSINDMKRRVMQAVFIEK